MNKDPWKLALKEATEFDLRVNRGEPVPPVDMSYVNGNPEIKAWMKELVSFIFPPLPTGETLREYSLRNNIPERTAWDRMKKLVQKGEVVVSPRKESGRWCTVYTPKVDEPYKTPARKTRSRLKKREMNR